MWFSRNFQKISGPVFYANPIGPRKNTSHKHPPKNPENFPKISKIWQKITKKSSKIVKKSSKIDQKSTKNRQKIVKNRLKIVKKWSICQKFRKPMWPICLYTPNLSKKMTIFTPIKINKFLKFSKKHKILEKSRECTNFHFFSDCKSHRSPEKVGFPELSQKCQNLTKNHEKMLNFCPKITKKYRKYDKKYPKNRDWEQPITPKVRF